MTPMKQLTARRNAYFNGQLLDESDFRTDQDYHRQARLLHNLRFHSWGVVAGLTVTRHGDTAVSVAPGFAIDSLGREMLLPEATVVDVGAVAANGTIHITLSYEEEPEELRHSEHGAGHGRMGEYAVLSTASTEGAGASVTLATIRLDGNGRVADGSIDYAHTRYASSVLAPGAVGRRELAEGLRSGWVRLPFKPVPLEDQRPFRIGPTEARSTEEGAAGTLAIPVPPGVTEVRRFRIAGELNEGTIKIDLLRCGWDPNEDAHERVVIFSREYEASSKKKSGPFEYTESLSGTLDPEYHALSIVVNVTRKTSIALIAVEFG